MRASRLLLVLLLLAPACNFPAPVPAAPTGTLAPTRTATVPPPPSATPTPGGTPTPWPTLAATPRADLSDLEAQAAAMRPGFEDDVEAQGPVTRYWIDVAVEYEAGATSAVLDGVARIRYTHREPQPLEDLVLILWPNDKQYESGMTAGAALIDGEQVAPQAELGDLALRYRLPRPLSNGESIDLTVPFHVIAGGPIGGGMPKRFGITEGVFIAPTFYPLVPRRVDGAWEVEEVPYGGDTTNSDTSFYWVRIHAAADLGLAASGVEVAREEQGGVQSVDIVAGPVRDFAFALGPFDTTERTVDGVLLRAWSLPEHAADVKTVLDAAALQLRTLSRLVGPYPYQELDIVDAPGAFGGIEYPSLIFIGSIGTHWLEIPTVHEVGHQWFYGLIGDDQVHQPWLDEAAATFTEALFYENGTDPDQSTWLLTEFRTEVRSSPFASVPIGRGVGDYRSEGEYGLVVYLKGALFFDALRRELGDDVFFDFLKAYFNRYRYGFASSNGFQEAAEATCACDLRPLFDLWVYKGGPLPLP